MAMDRSILHNLNGPDAPALVPFIADTGVEGQHVLRRGGQGAPVHLADLTDRYHLIGAGTQLNGSFLLSKYIVTL